MKKIHAALIAAAALLLAGSLLAGGLYIYGSRQTLPEGTVIAGWEIGGMEFAEVRSGLDSRLESLESLPLVLKAEGSADLTLTLKQAGFTYEAEDFLRGLNELADGSLYDRIRARRTFARSWNIGVHLETGQLKGRLGPDWENETFGIPIDAERRITADDRVVYTKETTSFQVDWQQLELLLRTAMPGSLSAATTGTGQSATITLEVPLTVKEPAVTLKALQDQGIERKITQFSTSLGVSGPGRTFNVEAAAKAVNGTILPPGAVFDYGKAIEKAQARYGFREAPVIVDGKLTPGTGGGICQVSSTLYNAAIRTGLEIVERRNHSLPVNYLPKGQDATFAQGYINFRFRNNTGKYLIIKAAVQGRTLTVKLFGTFPRNVTYSVQSRTVEVLPPADKYVSDPSLPRGGTRVLQKGKTGYVVETYITRYVDGKEVEKKKLSRDVYYAQKRVIAINRGGMSQTVQPQPTQKPLIEDGVRGG
ncbi:vancomycin resistance protein [Paenibacillus sp. PK3_47]|uniref:VanW family protein n=1 Tax=Paenibacillus sp. PK3_47 TaxID=2072642 RepID=UPI00201E2C7C|nr:VanW family protein [Paenibacillus sp. PK3_47]UQZ33805.1 vancomycin resistance protein [Paenibacillus sp. PK3_47]